MPFLNYVRPYLLARCRGTPCFSCPQKANVKCVFDVAACRQRCGAGVRGYVPVGSPVAGRDVGSGRLLNVEPTTHAKKSVPWVEIFTGTFSTPAGRSLAAPAGPGRRGTGAARTAQRLSVSRPSHGLYVL